MLWFCLAAGIFLVNETSQNPSSWPAQVQETRPAVETLNRRTGEPMDRNDRNRESVNPKPPDARSPFEVGPDGTIHARPRRRLDTPPVNLWRRLLGEPRNAVIFALIGALLFGGGKRLRHALLRRDAMARLDDPAVAPSEIEAAGQFGRAGLLALFQILETAKSADQREAAGRALAILWARDDLIAEEEKAIVIRGHAVAWRARRRYPRGIQTEIPIAVQVDLTFLREGNQGIKPEQLEWSSKLSGARRASLEVFGPWKPGRGQLDFQLVPQDFESNGPHQLTIQTRVRTVGLTDQWEITLPHSRLLFEFDPLLQVSSLFTLPDESREAAIQACLALESQGLEGKPGDVSTLSLGDAFAMASPPDLVIKGDLPCDLAHRIEVEFEEIEPRVKAGTVIAQRAEPPQTRWIREDDSPLIQQSPTLRRTGSDAPVRPRSDSG